MRVIICRKMIGKSRCNTLMEKMIESDKIHDFEVEGYKSSVIARSKIKVKQYMYVCKHCGNEIWIEER